MRLLVECIRQLILEKTDSDKKTFMIALYPSEESIRHIVAFRKQISQLHDLSSMKEIPPDELHATIRWWEREEGGDISTISKELEGYYGDSIVAEISDVDVLGESLSLMLASIQMKELFEKVDALVQSQGGPPSQYPRYIPHLSLYYGSWDDVVVDQVPEMPEFNIVFDKIKLVDGDDNIFSFVELNGD